jgi:hypothetical protein
VVTTLTEKDVAMGCPAPSSLLTLTLQINVVVYVHIYIRYHIYDFV